MENSLAVYLLTNPLIPDVFDHTFNWGTVKRLNVNLKPVRPTSTVRVSIYHHKGFNLVILQDLGIGTSVTNASEQIATEVGILKNLDPEKTIWLECYPYHGGDYNIDRIHYVYNDHTKQYSNPVWGTVNNPGVVEFLRKNLKTR